MLDVKTVGAELTPAQRDETMDDLRLFLDEFGSTGAVRVALQERESSIRSLKEQVQRLLTPSGERLQGIEEGEIAAAVVEHGAMGMSWNVVDATMVDVDFFLRTFGSTRAVRDKLWQQKREIVGLKRTVQWLEERRRERQQSDDSSDVEYVGTKRATRSMREEKLAMKPQVDPCVMNWTREADEIVGSSDESDDSIMEIEDTSAVEKAEAVVIAASEHEWQDEDFEDGTCLLLDCTNTAQANGFCYAHGGYQVCYALGCNRRAAVRASQHKRAASSGTNDLHTAEYDGNDKSARSQKVLVQLDYCDKHLAEEELDGDHAAEASSQAQRVTDRRYRRHSVCKWLGCMKWVTRDRDSNEYCVLHRAQDGSSVISRGSSVSSVTHSEDDSSVHRDYKSPILCKEPGCSKQGYVYGDRKGYCFQHGGGVTCIVPGCPRQRQLKGLCRTHGGYHQCDVDGCTNPSKATRGYCSLHILESNSTPESRSASEERA